LNPRPPSRQMVGPAFESGGLGSLTEPGFEVRRRYVVLCITLKTPLTREEIGKNLLMGGEKSLKRWLMLTPGAAAVFEIYSLSLSHTRSLSRYPSRSRSLSRARSFSRCRSLSPALSLSLARAPSLSRCRSLSLSRSLSAGADESSRQSLGVPNGERALY